MDKDLLLNLLERVLKKGYETGNNNYAFYCPNCKHHKHKLEINLETENWACWVCGNSDNFKGLKIKSLFRRLEVSDEYLKELRFITKEKKYNYNSNNNIQKSEFKIQLPKEYIPLYQNKQLNKYQEIIKKHALNYLKSRNISDLEIKKYEIGFCTEGRYKNRIILPSYDSNNNLNYYMARSFEKDSVKKYDNPHIKKDTIIGYESFINWSTPIILCEGIFDAIAIKRNVIPLFGKDISSSLMKKIVTQQVNKIYIALDNDALKDSLYHCEQLLNAGKEVYWVELIDKDPSEIGFNKFLDIISNTQPLTLSQLLSKKIEMQYPKYL